MSSTEELQPGTARLNADESEEVSTLVHRASDTSTAENVTSSDFKHGDIVWTKLGSCWWPGEVYSVEFLSEEVRKSLRKVPFAVVKFFDEDNYEFVKNEKQIRKYECEEKHEFIRRGLEMHRAKNTFMEKFPSDVTFAELQTNGDPDILTSDRYRVKTTSGSGSGADATAITPFFISAAVKRKKKRKSIVAGSEPASGVARGLTHLHSCYVCDFCDFQTDRVDCIVGHQRHHYTMLGTVEAIVKMKNEVLRKRNRGHRLQAAHSRTLNKSRTQGEDRFASQKSTKKDTKAMTATPKGPMFADLVKDWDLINESDDSNKGSDGEGEGQDEGDGKRDKGVDRNYDDNDNDDDNDDDYDDGDVLFKRRVYDSDIFTRSNNYDDSDDDYDVANDDAEDMDKNHGSNNYDDGSVGMEERDMNKSEVDDEDKDQKEDEGREEDEGKVTKSTIRMSKDRNTPNEENFGSLFNNVSTTTPPTSNGSGATEKSDSRMAAIDEELETIKRTVSSTTTADDLFDTLFGKNHDSCQMDFIDGGSNDANKAAEHDRMNATSEEEKLEVDSQLVDCDDSRKTEKEAESRAVETAENVIVSGAEQSNVKSAAETPSHTITDASIAESCGDFAEKQTTADEIADSVETLVSNPVAGLVASTLQSGGTSDVTPKLCLRTSKRQAAAANAKRRLTTQQDTDETKLSETDVQKYAKRTTVVTSAAAISKRKTLGTKLTKTTANILSNSTSLSTVNIKRQSRSTSKKLNIISIGEGDGDGASSSGGGGGEDDGSAASSAGESASANSVSGTAKKITGRRRTTKIGNSNQNTTIDNNTNEGVTLDSSCAEEKCGKREAAIAVDVDCAVPLSIDLAPLDQNTANIDDLLQAKTIEKPKAALIESEEIPKIEETKREDVAESKFEVVTHKSELSDEKLKVIVDENETHTSDAKGDAEVLEKTDSAEAKQQIAFDADQRIESTEINNDKYNNETETEAVRTMEEVEQKSERNEQPEVQVPIYEENEENKEKEERDEKVEIKVSELENANSSNKCMEKLEKVVDEVVRDENEKVVECTVKTEIETETESKAVELESPASPEPFRSQQTSISRDDNFNESEEIQIISHKVITPSGEFVDAVVYDQEREQRSYQMLDINAMPIMISSEDMNGTNSACSTLLKPLVTKWPQQHHQIGSRQMQQTPKITLIPASAAVTSSTATFTVSGNASAATTSTRNVFTSRVLVPAANFVTGQAGNCQRSFSQKITKIYKDAGAKGSGKPVLLKQSGKPGEFVIVPSQATPSTGSKYTVGKNRNQQLLLQQKQLQQSRVLGKHTIAALTPSGLGNLCSTKVIKIATPESAISTPTSTKACQGTATVSFRTQDQLTSLVPKKSASNTIAKQTAILSQQSQPNSGIDSWRTNGAKKKKWQYVYHGYNQQKVVLHENQVIAYPAPELKTSDDDEDAFFLFKVKNSTLVPFTDEEIEALDEQSKQIVKGRIVSSKSIVKMPTVFKELVTAADTDADVDADADADADTDADIDDDVNTSNKQNLMFPSNINTIGNFSEAKTHNVNEKNIESTSIALATVVPSTIADSSASTHLQASEAISTKTATCANESNQLLPNSATVAFASSPPPPLTSVTAVSTETKPKLFPQLILSPATAAHDRERSSTPLQRDRPIKAAVVTQDQTNLLKTALTLKVQPSSSLMLSLPVPHLAPLSQSPSSLPVTVAVTASSTPAIVLTAATTTTVPTMSINLEHIADSDLRNTGHSVNEISSNIEYGSEFDAC